MRYTISLPMATLLLAGAAMADVPKVVTDIPPVQALVAQVMGDLGAAELLLEQGANAHSFQLRPRQAQALDAAGLIVWIGPEMTPWLDRTLEGLESTAPQLRLLAAPGTFTQPFGADGGHDHGDGHDHAAEAGHDDHADGAGHDDHAEDHDAAAQGGDHDGHSHDGTDPHAWLDPANATLWLDAIATELSRIDPENAATYQANAAQGQAQIAAVDAEVAEILAPVKDRPFLVFHDAYAYFTGHYGLHVAGTLALGDAAAPGAQRLAALRDGIAGGSAVCIFPEAQHDPKQVAQMAEGTTLRVGGALDPEGATLEPGAGLYPALLRGLATTIATCLAG